MRLEPIILELEREQNDLLIIAHESVLRVLYGYLMACNAIDIPNLEFPRDEIVEVSSARTCTKTPFTPTRTALHSYHLTWFLMHSLTFTRITDRTGLIQQHHQTHPHPRPPATFSS